MVKNMISKCASAALISWGVTRFRATFGRGHSSLNRDNWGPPCKKGVSYRWLNCRNVVSIKFYNKSSEAFGCQMFFRGVIVEQIIPKDHLATFVGPGFFVKFDTPTITEVESHVPYHFHAGRTCRGQPILVIHVEHQQSL